MEPANEARGKKPVVVKNKALIKEAHERLDQARRYYGEMQRSWFYFARTIKAIRDSRDFDEEYSSFQEFCEKEFSTVNYSTISKFITIVETWGKAIEGKLDKDKDFQLPAYETCYTLSTAKDKIDEEDFTRLKKQILDHKMSYYTLRAELKTKLEAVKRKLHKDIEESSEIAETQLLKELHEDGDLNGEDHESEFMDSHDVSDEEEEVDDDVPVSDVTMSTGFRVDWLLDNIGELEELVRSKGKVTEKQRELAFKVQKLRALLDNYLQTVEEMDA